MPKGFATHSAVGVDFQPDKGVGNPIAKLNQKVDMGKCS